MDSYLASFNNYFDKAKQEKQFLKNALLMISLIGLAFFPPVIEAQIKSDNQPIEYKVWSGYSFKSVRFLGKTRNAVSAIFGIGGRKAIRQYGKGRLYYTADIIPYIYFDYPKRDEGDRFVEITGLGISPAGFEFVTPLDKLFLLQLSISGSLIFVEERFPTDKGRRLNYTFDPSISFLANISVSFAIATGYKFHHISNAQTGSENPGLDSNFLYISIFIK